MEVVTRPWAGAPRQWIIVFDRKAATWWINWLPLGKYKHVRAFGYVPEAKAFIFYDVAFDRTMIAIACDQAATALIREWLTDADAISMPARAAGLPAPRIGFWCVQAIKHLIGLRSGALRPSALWRDCLRQGGEIVANENVSTGTADTAAAGCGP